MPLLPDTWTVKEVVADLKSDLVGHLTVQDGMLREIDRKVDSKADKADLLALGIKIDGHGSRITALEEHRLDTVASKRFRNRAWTVAGSIAGVLAILGGALIGAFVH